MVFMVLESYPCQQFIDMSDVLMEQFLKGTGVAQYRKLCFAVHELVINAVEGALRYQAAKNKISGCRGQKRLDCTLWLRMELEEGEIVVTISNYAELGVCQEIRGKSSLSMEELLLEERGRGLLIAKQWSDQITYEQDEDGKFTIQLRKKGDVEHEQTSIRSERKR
ncbi:ATP-binding protein [Paenibacillus sp. RC67]|uniref:ATP-binding protein n=1 Tax=Paenibacillus sp. RC67 TaxID=3039392 RepID=UPI0024AD70BD|nr:ATP-binding protein [Paenibacillus sp. RC67]